MLNVVSGHDAVLGPVLIQDPRVRKVGFTGSVGAGERIMAMCADNLTRVLLELGGNDPAIVLEDAVIDEEAIGKLYVGAFLTTGQVCMAMKRLYVHRSHYDAVVEGLSGAAARQKIGPGLHADATMGPLNSARQRDYVKALLDEVRGDVEVRELAEPVDEDAFARGQFMRPSLVLDPRPDARVVTEEQFGPYAPDHPVRRRGVRHRRGQRHLVGPLLVGVVGGHGARRPRRRPAAHRLHVRQRPQRTVPRRARAVRRVQPERDGREMGEEGILGFTDTHSVGFPGVVDSRAGSASGGPRVASAAA